MTPSKTDRVAAATRNSVSKVQSVTPPLRSRIHTFFNRLFGRKPAYLVTRNGIEVHWFDFSDTDTLPFDRTTYADTQLFLGNWANPWYVDLDSIEESYPDFTKQDITTVEEVFSDDHVYPSQRYKIIANQNVLRDMFVSGGLDSAKLVRLLYAVLAGVGFAVILLLFGGA